jgi:hypothetical protein
VELRLTTPIDTDTAAAGDAVSAAVVHAVHPPRSTDILVPAGAVVHGRLSLVERHLLPMPHVIVGIAWESLEADGEPSPFAASLEGKNGASSVVTSLAGTMQKTPIPDGPPNSFVFVGEKRHAMAGGGGKVGHALACPCERSSPTDFGHSCQNGGLKPTPPSDRRVASVGRALARRWRCVPFEIGHLRACGEERASLAWTS